MSPDLNYRVRLPCFIDANRFYYPFKNERRLFPFASLIYSNGYKSLHLPGIGVTIFKLIKMCCLKNNSNLKLSAIHLIIADLLYF